jgi:hypothetical protein
MVPSPKFHAYETTATPGVVLTRLLKLKVSAAIIVAMMLASGKRVGLLVGLEAFGVATQRMAAELWTNAAGIITPGPGVSIVCIGPPRLVNR